MTFRNQSTNCNSKKQCFIYFIPNSSHTCKLQANRFNAPHTRVKKRPQNIPKSIKSKIYLFHVKRTLIYVYDIKNVVIYLLVFDWERRKCWDWNHPIKHKQKPNEHWGVKYKYSYTYIMNLVLDDNKALAGGGGDECDVFMFRKQFSEHSMWKNKN